MRKPLQKNAEIILYEIGTDKKFIFRITDVIGMGASCIVYTAVYTDLQGNEFAVRLKELYPADCEIIREDNNSLRCSSDEFEKYLTRFTDGYQKQLKFRQLPESMNSISNIQGIYEGNCTVYIAMSCQNGISIDDNKLSLYNIFRVLKAITLQIENFHKNGYLYLDLKPENIILYPETPELVMLFDFDSAITADELKENPSVLSYTQKYSAPEVCQHRVSKIDVASDIYTLGALLMYMIFKRSPGLADRRRNALWDSELGKFFSDESPEVKRMITEIFRNTLSADPQKRYSSCAELLSVIEPFILSFQKEKPYLKTILPLGNNYFCGRSTEISEIHDILKTETNFLILHGIGGIGKSELAKHYAMTYKSEYDAAVFVRFQKNMTQTIVSDMNFPIVNCKRSDDESDEEYLKRKINILQKICTDRHLIILDNFDVEDCDDLELLTGLPCNILVTSRVDYSDVFYQYEVEELQNEDDIFSLVTYYYKATFDEENSEAVWNIISDVEGHTMAIELIAKHMQNLKITPIEMYEKLSQNGITSGSNGKVRNVKDGSLKSKAAYAHISALFSIFGLSEDIKQVLRYAALFGANRIDKEFFIDSCELTAEQKTAMKSAIICGWIQEFTISDTTAVTIHPLVSDVLCHELKPDIDHCADFILFAAVLSENVQDFDCEQRYLHIAWLDHTARNIHGNSTKITFLLDNLNMVYMAEEDYESARWCNEKIVDMIYALHEEDNFPRQILNSYLFLKTLASFDGDEALEQSYIEKIKALNFNEAMENLAFEKSYEVAEEGDYDTAISSAKEQLEYAILSEDGRRIAKAYRQIGEVEREFENEDKAVQAFEKAVEYIEEYLNNYPEEIEHVLEKLYDDAGDIYTDAGKCDKALEMYQKEMELSIAEHGEISGYVKDIYFSMSYTYFQMGDRENQLECLKKCLEISEKVYGKVHQETAICYEVLYKNSIAKWHENHDNLLLDKCSDMIENLIEAQIALNGEESIEVAEWCMEYSDLLRLKNDEEGCYSFMKTAMGLYSNFIEDTDELWSNLYCRASDSLLHFGDTEKSLAYLDRAIEICEITDDAETLETLLEYRKAIFET